MPTTLASTLTTHARRLLRAKLVKKAARLTRSDVRRLNRLTRAEVNALIAINRKLGRTTAGELKRIGFFIF